MCETPHFCTEHVHRNDGTAKHYCRFQGSCKSKDPQHLQQFLHLDLPVCRFGARCRNMRDMQHRLTHLHGITQEVPFHYCRYGAKCHSNTCQYLHPDDVDPGNGIHARPSAKAPARTKYTASNRPTQPQSFDEPTTPLVQPSVIYDTPQLQPPPSPRTPTEAAGQEPAPEPTKPDEDDDLWITATNQEGGPRPKKPTETPAPAPATPKYTPTGRTDASGLPIVAGPRGGEGVLGANGIFKYLSQMKRTPKSVPTPAHVTPPRTPTPTDDGMSDSSDDEGPGVIGNTSTGRTISMGQRAPYSSGGGGCSYGPSTGTTSTGRSVYTGSRGGSYVITSGGNRSYSYKK